MLIARILCIEHWQHNDVNPDCRAPRRSHLMWLMVCWRGRSDLKYGLIIGIQWPHMQLAWKGSFLVYFVSLLRQAHRLLESFWSCLSSKKEVGTQESLLVLVFNGVRIWVLKGDAFVINLTLRLTGQIHELGPSIPIFIQAKS